MIPFAVISMTPGVSSNFRYTFEALACPKPFDPRGQAAVQQVGQHRQRQVEVHIQPDVAAQAIEVEERDLFTEAILDVIPLGISLDDLAGRLSLRAVIQAAGRRSAIRVLNGKGATDRAATPLGFTASGKAGDLRIGIFFVPHFVRF